TVGGTGVRGGWCGGPSGGEQFAFVLQDGAFASQGVAGQSQFRFTGGQVGLDTLGALLGTQTCRGGALQRAGAGRGRAEGALRVVGPPSGTAAGVVADGPEVGGGAIGQVLLGVGGAVGQLCEFTFGRRQALEGGAVHMAGALGGRQ